VKEKIIIIISQFLSKKKKRKKKRKFKCNVHFLFVSISAPDLRADPMFEEDLTPAVTGFLRITVTSSQESIVVRFLPLGSTDQSNKKK